MKDQQEAKDRVIRKALTDPAFKRALLVDANKAIVKDRREAKDRISPTFTVAPGCWSSTSPRC